MNTFLPYPDFAKSAAVLDDKRLNCQINEALIILRTLTGWYAKNGGKGWPNHPFVLRWRGYECYLADYCLACIEEYSKRHYFVIGKQLQRMAKVADALGEGLALIWNTDIYKDKKIEWLNEEFCRGHRQLLLEKDFAFYSKKFDASELGEYNVLV